jgi:hypothetical protein
MNPYGHIPAAAAAPALATTGLETGWAVMMAVAIAIGGATILRLVPRRQE